MISTENNYTVYNNININNKIDSWILLIIIELNKIINTKEINSIILTGSFGQGEGGIIINTTENNYELVNDIDIIIFPKNVKRFKKQFQKKIKVLSEFLIKDIPVKQIDINIGDFKRFYIRKYKLFYTVNAHDTIHGHKILFGNPMLNKFKSNYDRKKYLCKKVLSIYIPVAQAY